MRNVPLAVLPERSVAAHATMVVPARNSEPDAAEQATGTDPSTVSIARTVNVTSAPPNCVGLVVMSAGRVSAGFVVSRTGTVNVFCPTLPARSVALHETVVVPSGNSDPDIGVQNTGVGV